MYYPDSSCQRFLFSPRGSACPLQTSANKIRKKRLERFSHFWSDICSSSKFIRWRMGVWCRRPWLFTDIYGWIDTSSCWCYRCQVNLEQALGAVINVTVVVTDTIYCLLQINAGRVELLRSPMHTQFSQLTPLCTDGFHKYILAPSQLLAVCVCVCSHWELQHETIP